MCGIAGIINKTPRTFDYATFCSLGISNDSRGGDSCGVFIDGRYEYGVGDTKFFSSYFQDSKLLDETEKATIALVHCRKASVGVISEKTAQPVVITKDGRVEFVLMHNGTIYNYEKLAQKYIPDVDITGMTDSQVMAHIFYYAGYSALNEYNGGAVFVIVDYRGTSPKTLFFRGSSKKTLYSKEAEAERPLYYCIDKTKRELVFSSIWMYLMALRKDCTTYALRTNKLLEFNGTSFVLVEKYDRVNMQQNKEVTAVARTYPAYEGAYGGYSYYGKYGAYDDYQDDSWFDIDTVPVYDNYISVDLLRNIYSYKGKKIHGKLSVNDFGRVGGKLSKDCEVWFFSGVALKNKHCYNFLNNLKKESKLSDKDFFFKFENVIRFLSIDGVYPKGDYWYQAVSASGSVLFTGVWQPMTSVMTTRFSAGTRVGTSYKGVKESVKSKILDKLDINFKTIKEECKSLMK